MRRWSVCILLLAVSLTAAASLPVAAGAAGWTVRQLADPEAEMTLFGVSCPTTGLCVASGSNDTIASSTNPTGDASAWRVIHPGGGLFGEAESASDSALFEGAQIRGVSCPSSGLCVAAGFEGNVFSSTDPTGGLDAWAVSPTGPPKGRRIHMTGVSCGSPSLCVAVAYAGKILTSTDPAGGGWTITELSQPLDLRGVSCFSTSLCVAVDRTGDILSSTDPTGGAGAWNAVTPAGTEVLSGVSCPSPSLCVTANAGQIITSTNPALGTWSPVPAGSGLPVSAVSCPTPSACAAVDNNSDPIVSTNPTGGQAAWSFTNVIPAPPGGTPNGTFGISCASISLCVAVGQDGQIITSTEPFAGGSQKAKQKGGGKRPRVKITGNPAKRLDGRRGRLRVSFHFHSIGPASRFRCRLSGRPRSTCRSPRHYRVGRGVYTFEVFAIGPTGAKGPPARFHFRVGALTEGGPTGSCHGNRGGSCVPSA